MSTRRRCVIYTRTSTEEGLGQDFNSLHAQAEACAAYIKSQIGEGWLLSGKAYEDGGYSGGSMERPAFKRLLADIEARRVDVVVVYKVDRLTRSLADFAKIMEVLDKAGTSFVSVTQSFNTTTSMGRLTLNVLLSFAQFEREVTGERIRDKLAASKAKGMWMGGKPPLGYEPNGRTLAINEDEALDIRLIFERFLALRSVHELEPDIQRRGVTSKKWTSKKGLAHGGCLITRGALYAILTNPLYRGMIRHKGKLYPGQHQAIVNADTWDAAQAIFSAHGDRASPTTSSDLLKGKLFDDAGHAMVASTGHKGVRRYRYYVSSPALRGRSTAAGSLRRVAMLALDDAVLGATTPLLTAEWLPHVPEQERVSAALCRAEIGARHLTLDFHTEALNKIALMALPAVEHLDQRTRVRSSISLARPRNATTLIGAGGLSKPRVDDALVRAITKSKDWVRKLETGEYKSILDLARMEKLCKLHTAKLLPLAFLAPDLIELILDGRQPPRLTLTALIEEPLPETWSLQRARFAEFN
jgi:site-specific DNA recombinase